MQPFRLTATGYNLNYLPEYIALRHGFFREQDLDVTVKIPTPWDGVLDELAEGRAELALGGAWVPSMYRDRVQNYTIFGQIANRCPLAIIRRTGSTEFKLADMVGRTVLMKSIGGASVGLFFKMLLREYGVDPRQVDYIQDLDGVMLGNLFQGGMGDYFITDNLSARIMTARNPNVSIALECVTQGEVPWSVYYQETARITPEALAVQERFFLGLRKGIEWVLAHDAESFRDELAELFPAAPIDVVVGLTNSFRREGMWRSTVIPPTAFNRWQQGLTDARLVKEPLTYESMVNDTAAAAAQRTELIDHLLAKKALINGKNAKNGVPAAAQYAVQPLSQSIA
jgi:NitT/TauT family transport system substrate-binding protein